MQSECTVQGYCIQDSVETAHSLWPHSALPEHVLYSTEMVGMR